MVSKIKGKRRISASRSHEKINRNIWFYRLFTEIRDGAINPLDFSELCTAVANLGDENKYLQLANGSGLVCNVPNGHSDRMSMLRVRWSDFPRVWTREGQISELNLSEDHALIEPTFVRFFQGNVVAIDVNRSGPWPTAIRDYLRDRLPARFENLQMVQILDRTALERLNRITTVKKLELQVSEATLSRLPKNSNNYIDALRGTMSVGEAGLLAVSWKKLGRDGQLNAENLKALVRYLIEHSNDYDDKSQITLVGHGNNGISETFRLKRDHVTVNVEVARTISRRIDETDAFEQLRIAFNSARDRFPPQDFLV